MSETYVIPERLSRSYVGEPSRYINHLQKGAWDPNATFQPVWCGGGVAMPYRVKRNGREICPDCLREEAAPDAARDAARVRNETRDRLDALDDAATETVLARLLTDAPDLTRQLLAAAADLDVDAVRDALNETGN